MFNLEEKITEWRRRMQAAGIKSPEPLDELESHLRDDVAQQIRAGVDAQTAFESAVRRLGEADTLKAEFAKTAKWTRLRKLIAGLTKLLRGSHAEPMPSLADFTPDAQESLAFAREEAPQLHHDFIGTEHVLLGLTRSQTGIVPKVLERIGVDSERVRREIMKWVGPGQFAPKAAAEIPYTPRAQRALMLAANEAKALNSPVVGAEHIFLGLLLEGHGVAALVLKSLEVDVERTRAEIRREMAGS
jgi:Clp amino terminal domain, pathogenicity island component